MYTKSATSKSTIIGLILLSIGGCLIGVSFILSRMNSSSIESVVLTGETMSRSGVETDSFKRIETVGMSGTNWGMSPFGSGKPLEEETGSDFKKPNTEWKTRTLSGITYVFGEGNPKEVAVPIDKIENFYHCIPPYTDREIAPGYCPETQYLTKETEQALKKMLESPLWEKVITECRNTFDYNGIGAMTEFDTKFITGNSLDINSILVISSDGRKQLNGLYELSDFLSPESRGNTIPDSFRNTDCFRSRSILATMANNILSSYNIGTLAQTEGKDTIQHILNDQLPQDYWLEP